MPELCRRCDVVLTEENFSPGQRRWKNRVCIPCNRKYQLEHFRKHRDRYCQTQRERNARYRAEMIAAYGGRCMCCGESEETFLTVDHVNNDGHRYRGQTVRGGTGLCNWLRKFGYPKDGFQLLCWNCNAGKALRGACPHEKQLRRVK